MRKIAVFVVLASVAAVIALRLVRADEEPVIAGSWRELRPPDFQ